MLEVSATWPLHLRVLRDMEPRQWNQITKEEFDIKVNYYVGVADRWYHSVVVLDNPPPSQIVDLILNPKFYSLDIDKTELATTLGAALFWMTRNGASKALRQIYLLLYFEWPHYNEGHYEESDYAKFGDLMKEINERQIDELSILSTHLCELNELDHDEEWWLPFTMVGTGSKITIPPRRRYRLLEDQA